MSLTTKPISVSVSSGVAISAKSTSATLAITLESSIWPLMVPQTTPGLMLYRPTPHSARARYQATKPRMAR
jgi:hypothetical protein